MGLILQPILILTYLLAKSRIIFIFASCVSEYSGVGKINSHGGHDRVRNGFVVQNSVVRNSLSNRQCAQRLYLQ